MKSFSFPLLLLAVLSIATIGCADSTAPATDGGESAPAATDSEEAGSEEKTEEAAADDGEEEK